MFLRSFGPEERKKKKDRNSNFILLERDKEEGVFSPLAPPFSTERERIEIPYFFLEREEINHRSSASNRETDEESYGMECVIVTTRSSTR